MQGQQGMGGQFGMQGQQGFNRWGTNSNSHQQMNGFQHVDYSGGWGNNHDQMLQAKIEMVYQKYDQNRNGQLEGQEFFNAYKELCLQMGMAPPNSYQDAWTAVQQCDSNRDGRVSKAEMLMLFKRIQGVNGGMQGGLNQGGMQGGFNQGGNQGGFGQGGNQGGFGHGGNQGGLGVNINLGL